MTASVRNNLAAHIRKVDGDNTMTPEQLGTEIAGFLAGFTDDCEGCAGVISRFAARINPDKRIGAGRLAELIVAEFQLDQE